MTPTPQETYAVKLSLTPRERANCRVALDYAETAFTAAAKACKKAELENIEAAAQLERVAAIRKGVGDTESIERSFEFTAPLRRVMRIGLQIMLTEVNKLGEKAESLLFDLNADGDGSVSKVKELQELARRLGEQLEIPEPGPLEELAVA